MSEIIQQGLMITVIGMGLVFLVIIFLWWLMGLLVSATTRKVQPGTIDPITGEVGVESRVPEMAKIETQRRAAAAAVAVGLALEQSHVRTENGDFLSRLGAMSPWQSVHRSRQLGGQHKRG